MKKYQQERNIIFGLTIFFIVGLIIGATLQEINHGPDPDLKKIRIEAYEKGFSDHADAIAEWRSKAPICNMWFIESIEDCEEEEKISNMVLETMFTTKKYQYKFIDVDKGEKK